MQSFIRQSKLETSLHTTTILAAFWTRSLALCLVRLNDLGYQSVFAGSFPDRVKQTTAKDANINIFDLALSPQHRLTMKTQVFRGCPHKGQ